MNTKLNYYRLAKISYIIGLWFFLEAYIFGTRNIEIFEELSNFSFLIMFFLFLTGSILWNFQNDMTHRKQTIQLTIAFFVLSIFWNVNLYISNGKNINYLIAITGCIVLNLSTLLFLGKLKEANQIKIHCLKSFIKNHAGILGILIIFAILSIQDFGIWFKSDSYTYYNSIVKNKGNWDMSLNTLSAFLMGGHTAYAYSFFLYIGEYIWHNFGYGIRAINLIFSEITIICFFAICSLIFKNLRKAECLLLTAIFAFSPLFFGISYLMSSDFPLLCFFVIFVFCYSYDLKILQWLAALALCFSKEIGIVILFGFYIGECASKYADREKNARLGVIKELFYFRNFFPYSGALFYLAPILLSNAGWMNNLRNLFFKTSEVKSKNLPNLIVKWHYYLYKIEELFIMNFMWVILLFILVTIFIITIRMFKLDNKRIYLKEKLHNIFKGKFVLPLFFSYIMFIAINMLYFTYVHYRYIQLAIVFHILMLGVAIGYVTKKQRIRVMILSIFTTLFLVESYITIDPITYLVMPQFDAGNGKVVNTRHYFYGGDSYGFGFIENDEEIISKVYLHEGLDYNRQQLGLQYVLEKSLFKIGYNSNKLIVLDNFGGWFENTCWSLFGANRTDGYYWDKKAYTVTSDNQNDEINLEIAKNESDYSQYNEIYYFDFTFNKFIKDDFLEENKVINEFEVSCGVWKIKVYQVK